MTASTTTTTAPPMEWLLSEPLLDAALAQTKSVEQFSALKESFKVAEASGQEIPDSIRAKLANKQKELHADHVKAESQKYLQESGLWALVEAKRKWVSLATRMCA